MRIGVNCYLLGPSIGGLKQYFQTLFRELLEHDQANDYVFFYVQQNIAELEAIEVGRWRRHAVLLTDQNEVRDHLEKIDLYFCPFGAIWPVPVPRPSVVTLVDLQEKYYPDFFTEMDHWNRNYHFHGSTHQADRVITISNFSKASICQHHRISADKIDVIYLCPQHQFIQALQASRPPSVSLPGRFVFYPANHWKHKNHQCLIDALLILRRDFGLDIPVVVTGFPQPNGFPLAQKMREHDLSAIHFEFVSVEELAFLYQRSTLLCFPSLFEGFGIPVVEAMAAGCPVACSTSSSLPEVAGSAAFFFEPTSPADCAKAILTLWTDETVRRRLIASGKERAAQFTPSRMAAEHLATFRMAKKQYSAVRFLKNKLFFNPLHYYRVGRHRPRGD